jgi:ATP-dependent exoDNAse (exonuclease V) beta subunit
MSDAKKPVLTADRALRFPEFVLLKASAGSGKTHALSLRFVQFLLSPAISRATAAELGNILAITFTKNAAREMKERVLDWLKACWFDDPERRADVLEIVDLDPLRLGAEAGLAVERILAHYTDFQVETIDGFMAAIFKASALDLGHSPDFEIVLDNAGLIEYAFNRYLRRVSASTDEGRTLKRIVESILINAKDASSFSWDPAPDIRDKLTAFHARLAAQTRTLRNDDLAGPKERARKAIAATVEELEATIDRHGLEKNKRSAFWTKIRPLVGGGRFPDLAGASFKTDPVKKSKSAEAGGPQAFVLAGWGRLRTEVDEYLALYARSFFSPYLQAYDSLERVIDDLKRQQEIVLIEDINKELLRYIEAGIVPDIYFRLGDRIYHYLIDEFQDTSPIQWADLTPLIENSLAMAGSLFVVGDTKQAIYGFRAADYRIMAGMMEPGGNPFPSVGDLTLRELPTNYRSRERVLDYVKSVFLGTLAPSAATPATAESTLPAESPAESGRADEDDEEAGDLSYYREIAGRSSLNRWAQDVLPGHRASGCAEYIILDRDRLELPEKAEIQRRVLELRTRGYAWSDIAILTYKNESVVNVASWLNEIDVPLIPYSSLDIRKRKIAGELMAFLRFLDSPPDDLSFAEFLLGRILARKLADDGRTENAADWNLFLFECRRTNTSPLYVAFRSRHPEVWERYVEPFFKTAGYAPLYDLVTQAFRAFRLFELFPEDEAALAKFLEAIKDFEGRGRNDLQEFLASAGDDAAEDAGLNIDVPPGVEAVKIISIHKAKGLEFPVVILLLYGEKFLPEDFYLDEADPDSVGLCRLNARLAAADPALRDIYEETRARQFVDRLNTLYVALTRARSELQVIGVKAAADKYPFDILGEALGPSEVKPPPASEPRAPVPPAAGTLRFPNPRELPFNHRESLTLPNVRRGNLVHAILARIEFAAGGWESDLAEAVRALRPSDAERDAAEAVGRDIARYFERSPLAELFARKEGRTALREFSFCDASGQVFRMDRVVVDPDAVVVLDFKTGREPSAKAMAEREASDRGQLAVYRRILGDVFPGRPVRGILAYIDQDRWETLP